MAQNEYFLKLDESYLNEIAALYKRAFEGEPWNDRWDDTEQLHNYIKDLACAWNSLNYGLVIDQKLVAVSIGTVRHWWEGTNYNIEEFCVSPDMQRAGIGSRFLALIEEELLQQGIAGIFLQTDNDKPSYSFYLKNQFHELTSHVSFYKSIRK